MADITTLPGKCKVDDIIEIVERDGAVIVKDFVTPEWLGEFNAAIQTSIDDYTPYDYGEDGAMEFMEMSENGEFLALAHQSENKVSIYDVVQRKVIDESRYIPYTVRHHLKAAATTA